MIATYNIKVNGRWIRAGEEYEEQKAVKAEAEKVEKPEAVEAVPVNEVSENPKSENRSRSSVRRRNGK